VCVCVCVCVWELQSEATSYVSPACLRQAYKLTSLHVLIRPLLKSCGERIKKAFQLGVQ
jgi:hypothetical protein